jgi:large subunit ribosomal protein L16
MPLTPKKTAFRLSFRNKIKTNKIKKYDLKQRKPMCKHNLSQVDQNQLINILNKKVAWTPKYPAMLKNITFNTCFKNIETQTNQNQLNSKKFSNNLYREQKMINDNFLLLQTAQFKDWTSFKPKLPFKIKTIQTTLKTPHGLLFGQYGICAMDHGIVTTKFMETAKLDIAKALRKKGRVWLRICCDTPVTARPVETRMGKGKGAINHWEAKVRPYQLIFEFCGVSKQNIIEIFNNLCKKSGLQLKLIVGLHK